MTDDTKALVRKLTDIAERFAPGGGVCEDGSLFAEAATALQASEAARVEAERERDATANQLGHTGTWFDRWQVADVARLAAEARVERMREALKPFAAWASDNVGPHGWKGLGCQRERICDWFGPSEFRAARQALSDASQETPS